VGVCRVTKKPQVANHPNHLIYQWSDTLGEESGRGCEREKGGEHRAKLRGRERGEHWDSLDQTARQDETPNKDEDSQEMGVIENIRKIFWT
jgi:hypothetical protein